MSVLKEVCVMEKSYDIGEMGEDGKIRKGKRLVTSDIFAKAGALVKTKKIEAEKDLGMTV